MRDLDVILAAHGSGDESAANAQVRECARALETTLVGARVTTAFKKGEPSYLDAMRSATRRHRVVVPMLTSDGYFAEQIRSAASDAALEGGEISVLRVIGHNPLLAGAIARSVTQRAAAEQFDPARTRVVVVGHGTTRRSSSQLATRVLANRLDSETGMVTHAAYLDVPPFVEHVVGALPPRHDVVVVPFLLGGGRHAEHDVPARVATGNLRRGNATGRVTIVEPMGGLQVMRDALEQVVLEQRIGRRQLTVGARRSPLSRRQVELLADRLAKHEFDVLFKPIDTAGDRDLTRAISALGDDNCFTGDISDALLRGEIDVAVHSAKDLPLAPTPGIMNALVLPRASAAEALVSRSGETLDELPLGARVGTSCARRSCQLRRLRADLEVADIRGAVQDRVAAVDRGEYDAVVLAVAGLERLNLGHRIAQQFSLAEFHPAPAQGAIVAQCREDSPHRALLESAGDRYASNAIQAELAFAVAVTSSSRFIPAAYASARKHGAWLHARVIDPETRQVWDASLLGSDPVRLGEDAARCLLGVGGMVRRGTVS